ncbi:hypothetical protein P3T36_004859 [Kitasatospora sp. MAP12-15]|uniref:hypothetical protein n=1 Tax=unclassified Kitasatospora TaxID=2633591 RepID=UPI00247643FE|nr:hypothetical protein [Kitasatospora sp. MAP12-44]MDH6110209.1 hypothetical protein [Kitasatospora sp. MAP12-44]
MTSYAQLRPWERVYPDPLPGCQWRAGRQWWYIRQGWAVLRTRQIEWVEQPLNRHPGLHANIDLVLSDHHAKDGGYRILEDVWLPSSKLSVVVAEWDEWVPVFIRSAGVRSWRISGLYGRPWMAGSWIADMLNGRVIQHERLRGRERQLGVTASAGA